eukprot:403342919
MSLKSAVTSRDNEIIQPAHKVSAFLLKNSILNKIDRKPKSNSRLKPSIPIYMIDFILIKLIKECHKLVTNQIENPLQNWNIKQTNTIDFPISATSTQQIFSQKNTQQLTQIQKDRLRQSQNGYTLDIKQKFGLSDCNQCSQLQIILSKALRIVQKLEPDVNNKAIKTKIEKLFNKSIRVSRGLNFESSDEENQILSDIDRVNKKGGMSPKRRNGLIQSLQNDIEIFKKQKIDLEASKLKIQLQRIDKQQTSRDTSEVSYRKKINGKVAFLKKQICSSVSNQIHSNNSMNQQNYDKFSSFLILNNLMHEMMYTLDQDKVFQSMGTKFEKLLSCDQVIILKIVDNEKLDWANCMNRKQRNLIGKLNLRDKLIYECFSENESIVINEPDKDLLYHPKLAKTFHITPQAYNVLAQPILSHDQGYVGGIMLAFNKKNFSTQDGQFTEFSMDDQKVAKLCANLAALYMAKLNIYEQSIAEKNSVNFYLNFVDQILKHVSIIQAIIVIQPNCYMFQESVKRATAQLFNCERANFMFCDYEKGELYKNYLDEKGKEQVETFSLQKGLAGYVANSMNPLISNQIEDDTRFLQTIDDPQSQEFNANTKSILSVPILTSEEQMQVESLDVQCPRGVLQLINKALDKKFVEDDVRQVQLWGFIVGRAHQLIKQLEEFNSFKSNFGLMFDATNRAMMSIDANTAQMNQVLQTFLGLNNTITNSMMNRDLRLLQDDLD